MAALPHLHRGDPARLQPLGRRDNIHKARIKILVKERGADKFREEVEAEWAHLDGPNTLSPDDIERIETRFTRPVYENRGQSPISASPGL